jgi:3-hydroxyisobutyrate dehydrogenase-like beta-hydroxyacid dehydrogenase
MLVAVLGLGEAGGRIAGDLAVAGVSVRGFDPARQLDGIENADSAVAAVAGADVILSVNAATVALETAARVAGALAADALYADLNAGPPDLKRELAETLPVEFVDVALVGVVPASGLATPALASGAGAERFAALFRPLGMPVEVVSDVPGDASGLKLLRSVFMKGIAVSAIEALAAAEAAGVEDWVRADIAAVLGESLLQRLIAGSKAHAARRVDEMRAATAYVEQLGVEPRVARASAEWLAQLRDEPS